MQRGVKPKPTILKLIEGNRGKRPLNRREPPTVAALPSPPPHLKSDALEEWNRVSVLLFNIGLLSEVDRAPLAAYCTVYGRWVQAERAIAVMAENDLVTSAMLVRGANGTAYQNPLVGISNKAMADMVRYAVEFGFTPSSRSRVNGQASDTNEDDTERFFT